MTRLHPDALLDIRLSAILARGRYTTDPGAVIGALRTAAAGRDDLLVAGVGQWIGYYGDEGHLQSLVGALRAEFDPAALQPGIELGRSRRGTGHSTP